MSIKLSPVSITRPGALPLGPDRTRFRVWAPDHDRAEVVGPGRDPSPLQPRDDGWFEAEVEGYGPGDRYQYRLGGETVLPDPASCYQPDGVHAPSAVVDLAFDWSDEGWQNHDLRDYVIYEMHVGTFTEEGTFDAAIGRLDHLVEVGITAVEVMPVAQFPGSRNWGYDGVYLYAVQNSYGGPAGFQRFVDACHRKGLAVVLDVVYNHLGPEGNYLAEFGPYFTDRYRTPWGEAVNYDGPGSDAVRRFVIENAWMWVADYHVDALRLDAIHAIFDRTARPVLGEMADEVHARAGERGRTAYLIAENPLNDPRLLRPRGSGGEGLDAAWNDDFHHALHVALTGETRHYYIDFTDSVADLTTALGEGYVLNGRRSRYRGYRVGASSADLPRDTLVVFSQNHDQVGNRPLGDRLSTLVDAERLRFAAATVLLSPWVPLLFMGEEWGETRPFLYFVDHGDRDLLQAVRLGRASEFKGFFEDHDVEIPDPGDPATRDRSRLDWEAPSRPPHRQTLELYRTLLAARRRHRSLTAPEPEVHRLERFDDTIALLSCEGDDATLVLFNPREEPTRVSAPSPGTERTWRRVLDGAEQRFGGDGPATPETVAADEDIPLGRWGFVLYRTESA